MTDRDLIAAAATAAGKTRAEWDYDWLVSIGEPVARDMLWNPLTNSGQALELAVKLPGLDLKWVIAAAWQACDNPDAACAYVRRAITSAAGRTA